jgi:hypothetical protein
MVFGDADQRRESAHPCALASERLSRSKIRNGMPAFRSTWARVRPLDRGQLLVEEVRKPLKAG